MLQRESNATSTIATSQASAASAPPEDAAAPQSGGANFDPWNRSAFAQLLHQ